MFKDNMEYGEHLRSPELLEIMDDYICETKARLVEIEKLADYLAAREE